MEIETTKSRKVLPIILGIVVFILTIICIILFIDLTKTIEKNKYSKKKLNEYQMIEGIAVVDKIYIYGMHFNIEGTLRSNINIKDIELVLFDEKEEKSYKLNYEYVNDSIKFSTSKYINDGIYLDELNIGKYRVLLKITDETRYYYYSLYNNTKYTYMDYYTITRNGKNKYIEISSIISNLIIDIKYKTLPDNIYDITIDAGHGGEDSGAVRNDIYESYINLEVALKLKKKLEELGLKVKITRTGDYNPGNIEGISPYGAGGRLAIGHESKSKLFLSIHSNNLPFNPKTNGVEIYTSEYNNKKLASLIADNIVKETNIHYSSKIIDKVTNGVYVRNFTTREINDFRKEAQNDGYSLYESINTSTQYYYVIRETGGIVTHAYIDGRDKKHNPNVYYDTNIGLDGYLIEMGYMTSSDDLNLLLNKKDEYATAIANAIKNYLNITNKIK